VCSEIKDLVGDKTIVSIAAGITTKTLEKLLNTKNIIRVMPNTPALVGFGASGIFGKKNETIDDIFKSIGICFWLDDENQIDVITALSGSGPAYFFAIFEAMINSAIQMGLDENIAKKLCLQTAIGSATMAFGGVDIKTLRENVTSKGGTTQAALEFFTKNNLSELIDGAMLKAKNRANELSNNI